MSPLVTPAQFSASGLAKVKRVCFYLLSRYLTERNGAVCWADAGARDAYYQLAELWRLRRVA